MQEGRTPRTAEHPPHRIKQENRPHFPHPPIDQRRSNARFDELLEKRRPLPDRPSGLYYGQAPIAVLSALLASRF